MEIPTLEQLTHVVFHHSGAPRAQTFAQIERYHVTPESQGGRGWLAVGYHVVIEWDGTLHIGRPLPQQGAHAPADRMNHRSVGVCLIGNNAAPGQVWTPEQLYSARKYLDALDRVAPALVIVGHRDVKGSNTTCPGVDLATLHRLLGRP